MAAFFTKRPRNVGWLQAAAILYGDWGTSKAYVIGLGFAIAGYSSFWLVAAMGLIIVLVGINYITICKFCPFGGGVYASARRRSEVLALIGALFLMADFLITAALSAVSCFSYLGFMYPGFWAMGSISVIGLVNIFGPRSSGNIALFFSIPILIVVFTLALLSLPYIGEAIHNLQPLKGGFLKNWEHLMGIMVALSGIESIANTTGVMKLDPGTTENNPMIKKTAKKAILVVMFEVAFFTVFFGLMVNAIPNLHVVGEAVVAPEDPNIRDYMLRYMGYFFGTHQFGWVWGTIFGTVVGIVFAVLLLSAVNTAIVALVSLLYVMSRDGEMPEIFQKINRFGVPYYALVLATLAPVFILVFVSDILSLAELYAVGFAGAIATNLGVTSTDGKIPLSNKERFFMFGTFLIMAAVEVTLFIVKPNARRFAITVLTIGLILRAFVIEQRKKAWAAHTIKPRHASIYEDDTRVPLHYGSILCASTTIGKTLNFALQEAKNYEQPLYILFVREQKVITPQDRERTWLDDEEACKVFDYAKESSHEMTIKFFYEVSDSPATTITDMATKLHASRLIVGRPRQSMMLQMLRGNIIHEIEEALPTQIDLVVIS